jgi:hypothetical protein
MGGDTFRCQEPLFPTALEEATPDPIAEIALLHLDDLFEGQFLYKTARKKARLAYTTRRGNTMHTAFSRS